jgi:hypothetical protein
MYICLFLTYLKTLSVSQTIAGWLMNAELRYKKPREDHLWRNFWTCHWLRRSLNTSWNYVPGWSKNSQNDFHDYERFYPEECRLLEYKNPVRIPHETHHVSTTEPSQLMLCKIWGFHGGDHEECRLLGVTPCDSSKNRVFGGTQHLHHQGDKNWTEALCEEILTHSAACFVC